MGLGPEAVSGPKAWRPLPLTPGSSGEPRALTSVYTVPAFSRQSGALENIVGVLTQVDQQIHLICSGISPFLAPLSIQLGDQPPGMKSPSAHNACSLRLLADTRPAALHSFRYQVRCLWFKEKVSLPRSRHQHPSPSPPCWKACENLTGNLQITCALLPLHPHHPATPRWVLTQSQGLS